MPQTTPNARNKVIAAAVKIVAGVVFVGGVCVFFPSTARAQAPLASWQWEMIEKRIRKEYPKVQRISTGELAEWLASGQRGKGVLLDVRTRPEFEVSHLKSAVWIDPAASELPPTVKVSKDTPIVTYCSVGYRSATFAEKLRAAGYRDVRNVEGSIFKWANESRPLVHEAKTGAGSEPAATVHPFTKWWGRLLKPELRAPLE